MSPAGLTLYLHPDTPCSPLSGVGADCALAADGSLRLRYRLHGAPEALALPPPASPRRADELWRHTCCEVFVTAAGEAAYREFNFSPSGCWAAYAFDDYRRRSAGELPCADPQIAVERGAGALLLEARIGAEALPAGPRLQLAVAVVSEAGDGSIAYWALAHAGERPDFHLRAGFVLELARP